MTWDNYKDHFNLNLAGSNGCNMDASKYGQNVTFNSEGTLHTISVTASSGGSFYPKGQNGSITCPGNTSQTMSLIPDAGYRISRVTVDGVNVGRIQVKHFENVTSNHSLHAEFEPGDDFFDIPDTVVNTIETVLPLAFRLEQNHPNPFNPLTTIGYQIPERLPIRIKVHNIQGREVDTLINKIQDPGRHHHVWDAGGYSSGIYMVVIHAGSNFAKRKMLLIK